MDDLVIVYADEDYGQREAWSVFYTDRVICHKDDVDIAKKKLVENMRKEHGEVDESQLEYEVVPVEFVKGV